MAISSELKEIKKIYGESSMHLCREIFPTILENEGKLLEILTSTFSDNCIDLCETLEKNDLVGEFKNLIYSRIDVEKLNSENEIKKTPYEILDEAGYELFECKTEEEIQRFKKYYARGEELCTFNGGRLNRCEVFFAVRKDVDQIRRENFSAPKREDEYGTSVMGIQFNRQGRCTVSIKNRYNHTVNNPDATYGNDLDRIAPGLEKAFEELLLSKGLNLKGNVERLKIPGYVVAPDGKYYKYNLEKDGVYYCPKNIVIYDGRVETIGDPEKKILIDSFILDLENKKISEFDGVEDWGADPFLDTFENIERVEIKKDKNTKTKQIYVYTAGDEQPAIITIDKANQIIGYENENIYSIANGFMSHSTALTKFSAPNLQEVGNCFLERNKSLTEFSAPNLQEVGKNFLLYNKSLTEFDAPNLQKVGYDFMCCNNSLTEFDAPNLQQVGDHFLQDNKVLTEFSASNLQQVGSNFFYCNKVLTEFSAPNLQNVGYNFMATNNSLTEFSAPNLQQVGSNFFYCNKVLTEFSAPNLQNVGDNFMATNNSLTEFSAPNLQQVGDHFLHNNEILTEFSAPNLQKVGDEFLKNNPMKDELLNEILSRRLQKKSIDSKKIANLDKETKLTSKEISSVGRFLEKLKEVANSFRRER